MKKKFDFWQSYSDMTFGLLLVFMLLTGVAILNLNEQKREAEKNEEKYFTEYENYIAMVKDLEETRSQIEKIVGVKARILKDLEETFKEEGITIGIDENTGAIVFEENVFFDTVDFQLKTEGKKTLDKVMPVYLGVLLSEEYIGQIAEITIEGNCDSRGTYEDNLVLSHNRASTVALYSTELMEQHLSEEQNEFFLSILVISGRSEANLKYDEQGREDMDASRRVEVKFRLKDEETIKQIQKWFEGDIHEHES